VGSSSIAEEIIEKLEEIGATDSRYDGLDDFMFLGNIPSNKRSQLRKYLKSIGCTSVRIKEPDSFWYKYDEDSNREFRPELVIAILCLISLFMAVITIMR